MKRRLNLVPKPDLSFPPPFQEQAKYLELANKVLATDGQPQRADNVQPIDSSRHLRKSKTKKVA